MVSATISDAGPDFAARYAELRQRHPEISKGVTRDLAEQILGRSDELLANITRAFREGIPAYADAGDTDVLDSIGTIISTVVRSVGALETPSPEAFEPLRQLARRRVLEGFPLDALIRSVQIGTRELMAIVGEELMRGRHNIEFVLLLQDFAWDWANHATETIVTVHRELDLERTRHDRARRAEFLRALLHGQLSPEQITSEGQAYGLDVDAPYVAFRARPHSEQRVIDLAAAIGRSGAKGKRRALTELVEGDLVGCAPRRPMVGDEHLVAVGPPVELQGLRESFADATLALEAAEAFDLRGTVDLIELGPRSLALAAERAATSLDGHHLAPLDDINGGNEIELTARTLLACDQHVEATSRELHVHPNTVRYRMNRFRAVTGLDLRHTADVVTAWWLLHRRAVGQRARQDRQDRRAGLDRRLTG